MSPRSGRALLFDIDGTLADTDALHHAAYNQILNPYGHVFDHARYQRELQGFSGASIKDRFLSTETPERQTTILDEKEAVFRRLVADKINPVAGLLDLLDRADRHGVPFAAVTNAPRPNAEMLLAGLGITKRFAALVIGDELPHGKPHPMPYLEALRLLRASPETSVAFEDSRSGVNSASAAGIATVGIRTGLAHDELVAAGAAITADDFRDAGLLRLVEAKLGWD